jgi:hypothetical protein
VYFCFQKHNTHSIFTISSWNHITITSVGLFSTKSSQFSCSSDLCVPQRQSLSRCSTGHLSPAIQLDFYTS